MKLFLASSARNPLASPCSTLSHNSRAITASVKRAKDPANAPTSAPTPIPAAVPSPGNITEPNTPPAIAPAIGNATVPTSATPHKILPNTQAVPVKAVRPAASAGFVPSYSEDQVRPYSAGLERSLPCLMLSFKNSL